MKDRFGIDWTNIPGTLFWRKPHLGRRMFFRHLGAAVGGYMLLPSRPGESIVRAAGAGQPIGKAKNCLFVQLNGGSSHVDTFDLKTGAWTPPNFNPTWFDSLYWPQGLMPKLAEHMDSLAVVRSVRSWAAVHDLARNWVQIGRNPTSPAARVAPHIGSVVSAELGPQNPEKILPTFLALNTGTNIPGSGFLAPEHAPFFVDPNGGGLGNTQHPDGAPAFARRQDLLLTLEAEERSANQLGSGTREMMKFNESARGLMYNPTVEATFRFANDERLRYGNTSFGNALLAARNLLRNKLGTRFIQVSIGGWDNHAAIYQGAFNAGNQNSLARQFDTGMGALLTDLKQSGLLDETLVFCMGEFGRTVGPPNSQGGRDHFLQQAVLFAGAGIRGPKVIGSTDDLGRATAEPGWSGVRDIRAEDIEATIYSALGIDWMTMRRDDPTSRGFEYVPLSSTENLYKPVHELWG